jgi:urease accessory protein
VRASGSRVLIAASAASPVGGDDLEIDVNVGPEASADIGTVAATIVWPGPDGSWSSSTTACDVRERARLVWWPEPTVSVQGSRHRVRTLVRLASSAECVLVEEVALGRSGEQPGVLDVELRVERDGVPLVHHHETFGASSSAVGVGAASHALAGVFVGTAAGEPRTVVDGAAAAAWLPVAADAAVLLAVGRDRPAVWSAVDRIACVRDMVRPSDQTSSGGADARRT